MNARHDRTFVPLPLRCDPAPGKAREHEDMPLEVLAGCKPQFAFVVVSAHDTHQRTGGSLRRRVVRPRPPRRHLGQHRAVLLRGALDPAAFEPGKKIAERGKRLHHVRDPNTENSVLSTQLPPLARIGRDAVLRAITASRPRAPSTRYCSASCTWLQSFLLGL